MRQKIYCTYIMANERPTLYVGMSNDLVRRVYEHKAESVEGFTKRYHLHALVYYECFETPLEAIIREKQIKDMNRADKLIMIRQQNPQMRDLYNDILE